MSLNVMIEPDDRGRVSLSKIPGPNVDRYVGRRLADGSILLQPAVVVTQQALASLLKIQRVPKDVAGQRRPLGDVLAERGRQGPSAESLEAAKAEIQRRREAGERTLADITPQERAALVAGTAGGLSLGRT